MKAHLFRFLLLCLHFSSLLTCAQQTLLIEKIGTSTRYPYKVGDMIKLRVKAEDTIIRGKIWDISDSSVSIAGLRPYDVRLSNIKVVYKQFYFPKKLGGYLAIFGAVIFGAITTNHLINNEQVFTPDLFIISGAVFGASAISFALSEKRCRIGNRWKIKVMEKGVY
jgi:hypothetical protein